MGNIFYLTIFVITFFILLFLAIHGEFYSTNQVLLLLAMLVGNGGYYALSTSTSLEEAILANKLCYVIGVFAPILMFFLICEICWIQLKKWLQIILFLIQIFIFFLVCTIGNLPLYYKTIEFHQSNGISHLTKTYGPFHSLYLIAMVLYFASSIVVITITKDNKVLSYAKDLDIIIILEFLTIACYVLERIVRLDVELFPFANTISLIYLIISLSKMQLYSVTGNTDLIGRKMSQYGYILLDKKKRYMGCNTYAATIFPELLEWETEKHIPGSGGRFNTFLRQPLMKYIESGNTEELLGRSFSIKDRQYSFTLNNLKNRSMKIKGYIIEISDITDFVQTSKEKFE